MPDAEDVRGSMRREISRKYPENRLLLTGRGRYLTGTQRRPRVNGPDTAGAQHHEEVSPVMNIDKNLGQHTDLAMPASQRVRVASLRAFPLMTGAVASAAGQKCALISSTLVAGYSRIPTDVAVIKGAFPGTSAWSPPI